MKSEEDLCRLCLFQYTTPQDVSLEDDTIRVKLEATFSYAFPLHATLPKRVCSECMTTANELQMFFDTVRSNQDQLSASQGAATLNLNQTIDQDTDIFQVKIEPEPSDDECGEFISADLFYEPFNLSSIEISSGKIEPESSADHSSENSFTEREESMLSDQTTIGQQSSDTSMSQSLTSGQQSSDTSVNRSQSTLSSLDQSSDSRSSLELSKVDLFGSTGVRCQDCFLPFPSMDLYQTHLMTKHGRVLCTECGKSYANKNSLSVHTLNVHRARQLTCETCKEEFTTKQDYMNHVERMGHSGATQQCRLCQEWFKNKRTLQAHRKSRHSTACDVCQQVFPHLQALSGHMKNEHGRQFCEICDRLFSSASYLKSHNARKHKDSKRYACECCGKSFHTKGPYVNHMKNRHPFEWIEKEKQENDIKVIFPKSILAGSSE